MKSMLGLFRNHPMYSIIEAKEDRFEVYLRRGNFLWYYYEIVSDEKERPIHFVGLDTAKSFLREYDLHYYEDLEIKFLKDYKK